MSLIGMTLISTILTGFFALVAATFAYRWFTRYLLVRNTARQTIRSASHGFAEIHGRADPITAVVTPLSRMPVVAYLVEVSVYASKNSRFIMFMRAPRFRLSDETGSLLVDVVHDPTRLPFHGAISDNEYLIANRGSVVNDEGLERLVALSKDYLRECKKYSSGRSDYEKVEESAASVEERMASVLGGFERVESAKNPSPNTFKVRERAILPGDEMLVMGSIRTENGERILTKGTEGVFFAGFGVENRVGRNILSQAIAMVVAFLVFASATLFLFFG